MLHLQQFLTRQYLSSSLKQEHQQCQILSVHLPNSKLKANQVTPHLWRPAEISNNPRAIATSCKTLDCTDHVQCTMPLPPRDLLSEAYWALWQTNAYPSQFNSQA